MICELFHRVYPAIPNGPTRCKRQIVAQQMGQATLESPPDIGCRNVMSAQLYSLTDTRHCQSYIRYPKIMQFDLVARPLRLLKQTHVQFLPLNVLSNANVSRRRTHSFTCVNSSRPAAMAPALGFNGESPRAISSALRKRRHFTSFGKNSLAKVVFPAPLQPAIT